MPARKNWVELLTIKSREDKATNLTINNIDIEKCKKVSGSNRCDYTCFCGGKGNKSLESIIKKSGLFCKKCTTDTKTNKMKKTYKIKTGYDNPSQNPKVKKQKEETTFKNFGVKHNSKSHIIKAKKETTCENNWGCKYPFQNPDIKKKIKATCLERHGVENPQQSKKIRDKTKETCKEKYGFEYASQSEEVKETMKATNLKRHGVENPFQSEEVKEKIKATHLKTRGVEYASQSEEVKEKMKATNLKRRGVENPSQSHEVKDKRKVTNLKRRGVEHPWQSPEVRDKIKATNIIKYGVSNGFSQEVKAKIKATNLERYGVEYPMQNPEIFEKIQKSRWKLKSYTFKTGEIIKCQGYEPWALEDLEQNNNYTYEDYMNEPNEEFWYDTNDGKKHRYHKGGDIPFLRKNKIIEVKSDYTFYADFYVNLLKAQCVLEKGFGFEFWVYDKNKELSIMDSKLLTNKFIVNCELLDHFKSSRV